MLDWRDGNGERQRVLFATRREAEEAKRDVVLGVSSKKEISHEPKALKEALRFYDGTVSKGKASHYNEKAYFARLYKFLRGQGVYFVHETKPEHLEALKTERLAIVKGSTMNREFNAYRHFFSKAVVFKWTESNPCESVQAAAAAKNPRRIWTDEEFRKIVSEVPEWASHALWIMRWTGAGPTELGRVRWADIDFQAKTILFKRYKGTGKEFRRHLKMAPEFLELMNMLKLRAKQLGGASASDPVVTNSAGRPLDPRQLAALIKRAVRTLELPDDLVAYGIRHWVATELLETGVSEDVVRRIMGHQDVRTLVDNYSHVRQKVLDDAMSARGESLKRNDGNENELPTVALKLSKTASKGRQRTAK